MLFVRIYEDFKIDQRIFSFKCILNEIYSSNFISTESAVKDKKIAACCFLTSCLVPKNLQRLEGVQTKEKHGKRFGKKISQN